KTALIVVLQSLFYKFTHIMEIDRALFENKLIHFYGFQIFNFFNDEFSCRFEVLRKNNDRMFQSIRYHEFSISNFKDLVFNLKVLNEELLDKMEFFIKNPLISLPKNYCFAFSMNFKNFKTTIESILIKKRVNSTEIYSKYYIPFTGSYASFDRHFNSSKISIENIKEALNEGELNESLNESQKDLILDIVALIFVSEPLKNPCIFLLAPMFFEIKEKIPDFSFKLNFPSAFSGHSDESRNLNEYNYSFYKYKIDFAGNASENFRILLDRENEILNKWISEFYPHMIEKGFCDFTMLIEDLVERWYKFRPNLKPFNACLEKM
ncbi:unnamed protein product, partial [Brachionus calyciflorus]